jgi:hypothetical protein
MKVGDLVMFQERLGIITKVDDSHRQTWVSVLFSSGIETKIWEAHIEVVDGTR